MGDVGLPGNSGIGLKGERGDIGEPGLPANLEQGSK
jgi:hypothetical protein